MKHAANSGVFHAHEAFVNGHCNNIPSSNNLTRNTVNIYDFHKNPPLVVDS